MSTPHLPISIMNNKNFSQFWSLEVRDQVSSVVRLCPFLGQCFLLVVSYGREGEEALL